MAETQNNHGKQCSASTRAGGSESCRHCRAARLQWGSSGQGENWSLGSLGSAGDGTALRGSDCAEHLLRSFPQRPFPYVRGGMDATRGDVSVQQLDKYRRLQAFPSALCSLQHLCTSSHVPAWPGPWEPALLRSILLHPPPFSLQLPGAQHPQHHPGLTAPFICSQAMQSGAEEVTSIAA